MTPPAVVLLDWSCLAQHFQAFMASNHASDHASNHVHKDTTHVVHVRIIRL